MQAAHIFPNNKRRQLHVTSKRYISIEADAGDQWQFAVFQLKRTMPYSSPEPHRAISFQPPAIEPGAERDLAIQRSVPTHIADLSRGV